MSANSRPKATQIISQKKALYRQRIPEPGCTRKETVDVDILVISRNGRSLSLNNCLETGPFFELGFTPCKTEQPLKDMELQEKETQKD